MVVAAGLPKAGCHALQKAVRLLGLDCDISHEGYAHRGPGKHVYVLRDPRNILCSWLRFRSLPVDAEHFMRAIDTYDERLFFECADEHYDWLLDSSVPLVRYETLISDERAVRDLARDLGVDYVNGTFELLPGMTRTWNPEHSDYRKIWSDDLAAKWRGRGGDEMLLHWGY